MIGTGIRLKTDLVIFSINFGLCLIINMLINPYDTLIVVIVFSVFILASLLLGPYFRAFKRAYVKVKQKYVYWFFQLIVISCTAHILAFVFYLEHPNYLNALMSMLIFGVVLLVLCFSAALIGVIILLRRKK